MRRLVALVMLALLSLTACAQPIGTVGYAGGHRISEADVDRAAAAFAPYGFDRSAATLFVVEAAASKAIMEAKGLSPDPAVRAAAAEVPQIAALLDDARTREVALGVLDFGDLESKLESHGMAVAVADLVQLDPRYGKLTTIPGPDGTPRYVLTGLSGTDAGALSTVAPK